MFPGLLALLCGRWVADWKISGVSNAKIVGFALALALSSEASAQDFTLNLQPDTATLIPAQNTSFVVSMAPFNGFTSQVTLAVEPLPSGVTAQFSPDKLILPGTSVLTLSAASNADLGPFTLNISASGGGITNTTSSSVTVDFGLLPICTGAFQGQVTDIQTGLPVPGAEVYAEGENYYYTMTDANGMFIFTNVSLVPPDNEPADYSLYAVQSNYWNSAVITEYAVCDATNPVSFQILRKETGSVSGQVLDLDGGEPLTNATVSLGGVGFTNTDANGDFQFTAVGLNYSNAPITYYLTASEPGYWPETTNTVVKANSNSVVTLMLVPICTFTVTGQVVFAASGLPVTNVDVTVSADNSVSVLTDSHGDYVATGLEPAPNNTPIQVYAEASYPGYYTASVSSPENSCSLTPSLGLPPLGLDLIPPPPINNYGGISGHIYDLQTGIPITNAQVEGVFTDTNGLYFVTNVYVGSGSVTDAESTVSAYAPGYFGAYSNLEIYADEVVTQDLRMLRVGYGAIVGTVRDAATTLPIQGAYVYGSFAGEYTPVNGYYASGPLPLNAGNIPTLEGLEVSASGYWPTATNTTITQGNTNVLDINLLKICSGATIVGNVVDALTQKPITNATVAVSASVYLSTMTDTNGDFILTNITVGNNNSPIQSTLTASAPGFNSQSKTLTIFCDATIFTEFGVPETVFGGIDGYVTNAVTGLPLTNVFVGTGFGAATATDTNGYYSFTQVPLGANGVSRVWTVTAIPDGFPQQTESVAVVSNSVSRLNFGFGQPPTALIVTATGTPDPVTVSSNLLYLVILTNTVADALQVQLTDMLPPGVTFVSAALTNSPGTPFSAPVYSNNVVTTTAADFGSNSAVSMEILVTPNVTGTLTNVAIVSSSTTDLDPTGSNHTATVTTTVVGPATADLALFLRENSNSIVLGGNITYTLLVTNLGPADAPDVTLDDTLPIGAVYVSSTTSQGSSTPGIGDVMWNFGALSDQGFATATLVVTPTATGLITNSATVTLVPDGEAVVDTNLANNTASIVATVFAPITNTPPPLTNVTVQALGPITFNPQTGLYQQSVLFTNLSGEAAAAVRIWVLDLPSIVVLYNAAGSSNDVPYVEYDQTVAAGGGVVFLLEYYDATRQPFVSTNFVATVVAATTPTAPGGTVLQLDRVAFTSKGELTIEFASVPGHTYVVQYSSDMETWQTAVPPIVAVNTRTQWIDSGPPKTGSPPGAAGQRFYRIVQTN